VASKIVGVPRVGESPVSFECKVTQIIQLQRADKQPVPSWLVLGEVVAVHIAKWLLKDGIYDTWPPSRSCGAAADYFQVGPDAVQDVSPRRPQPDCNAVKKVAPMGLPLTTCYRGSPGQMRQSVARPKSG
jgi:hypothetical protein